MAIITISRKIASFGDETAHELAKLLNYNFIDRKTLEVDLIKRGISKEQLKNYDERKPSFWASLSKNRDSYFDYLREAVYEYASKGNCIFIGRGGFAILRDVPNVYSVRLVASDAIRIARLMQEFDWPEKKALALMEESDTNRDGFHRTFFNTENEDSSEYNMVLNSGNTQPKILAEIIKTGLEKTISPDEVLLGEKRVRELLQAQKIVNYISFELKLQIYFLEAEVSDDDITVHGVADNYAVIEKVLSVAREMSGKKNVNSFITLVSEYKPFV